MMIMTYEQILKVTEYQGVAINDKIRQKAIDMTEQLDLLSCLYPHRKGVA